MTKTELLNRFARSGEERTLLARVLDRQAAAEHRSVPAWTPFLSPEEQASAGALLRAAGPDRHLFYGGYDQAERRVCVFLPDWLEEEDFLADPEGPVTAVQAKFSPDAGLTHREILGSLMGLSLTREKLGDILVHDDSCQVLVLRETAQILVSQWESAGHWRLTPGEIPLSELTVTPPAVKVIRDTVAALRLDAVCASAFSVSRSRAAELIASGRVAVNHSECVKPDRPVAQGDVLTCRGMGKCALREVNGRSKKGRIQIVLERYL